MSESVTRRRLSEEELVAFFGAMLSMAAADGEIDHQEVGYIFDLLSLQELSDGAHEAIRAHLASPPDLEACLERLRFTHNGVRCGLLLGMLHIAWANEIMDPSEGKTLAMAQRHLRVSSFERAKLESFVDTVRELEQRGLDDDYARHSLKRAASELEAAAIPITAVYYGGSMVRLTAAGIKSALSALELSPAKVPDVYLALLLGVLVGVRLAGRGGLTLPPASAAADPYKTVAVVEETPVTPATPVTDNLQAAIDDLIERVVDLEETADESDEDRQALRALTKRLRALQNAMQQRRRGG
jgi:uncharacterized tellurite resistance protein B-like protein